MCGIAGIVDSSSTKESRENRVVRMCEAMVHRGPDDKGIESSAGATLGMRRLAIFDPANGHQPMSSRDGRYTLVFNGAIYNHRELRENLESEGWGFTSRCDTEVLLAALATWGRDSLPRLRGMFAFALWDSKEESLFAARDRFGIKPLYFCESQGALTVASELEALRRGLSSPPPVDPVAVAEFLAWLSVPAPRTIYKSIYSLNPGEHLTFKAGRLEIGRWWSFKSVPAPTTADNRSAFIREHVFERLKRLVDILLTVPGIILASPVVALAAIAIKLDDGGPVFFVQTRIGQHKVPFRILKLRTMTASNGSGDLYTRANDSRVTRVGAILRKARLDELPQLWNVFVGQMSLIGPRAEWDRLVQEYEKEIPSYHFRHLVRPGITGWAQVNYRYGEGIQDTLRKLEYDLYYIRNFSFTLDASIVLKTLHVMIQRKGH